MAKVTGVKPEISDKEAQIVLEKEQFGTGGYYFAKFLAAAKTKPKVKPEIAQRKYLEAFGNKDTMEPLLRLDRVIAWQKATGIKPSKEFYDMLLDYIYGRLGYIKQVVYKV